MRTGSAILFIFDFVEGDQGSGTHNLLIEQLKPLSLHDFRRNSVAYRGT